MKKYTWSHEEHAISPLTISPAHHAWPSKLLIKLLDGQKTGVNTFCIHKDNGLSFYCDGESWDKGSDYLIGKIQQQPKFVNHIKIKSEEYANKLLKLIRKVEKEDFSKWTNTQLANYLSKTNKVAINFCSYGFIPVLSDHLFNKYTHLLKKIIKQAIYRKDVKISFSEAFNTLSSPIKPILSRQSRIKFLKMILNFNKNLSDIDKKKIELFHRKWHWVSFGHLGPAVKFAETLNSARSFAKNKTKAKKELNELLNNRAKLIDDQNKLYKKLGLSKDEKYLFKVAQLFTYLKGLRMELLFGMNYQWSRILDEMSKRKSVPKKLFYYCSILELTDWLKNDKALPINELNQRSKYCVYIAKTETTQTVLTGQNAKAYAKKHTQIKKEVIQNVLVIHGNVASTGYAKGPVKIVNKASEINKVNKGDILLSVATNPALLPAMEKAAAFVTDVGGINSHAAIVARELKKPCIIGTKIATKVLKDGDIVELDTRKGDIKKV